MLGIDYDQENADYNWTLASDEVKQAENANLSSWARKSDASAGHALLLIGFRNLENTVNL